MRHSGTIRITHLPEYTLLPFVLSARTSGRNALEDNVLLGESGGTISCNGMRFPASKEKKGLMSNRLAFTALGLMSLVPLSSPAQQPDPALMNPQPPKHILWVISNFRTTPTLLEYKPLTPKEKFQLAAQDSFDRGTIALAALFAGESQLTNADKSFGQGVEGFAHYWATGYADFLIGDYMTEGIFPTLLHQDPRYFRRGAGRKLSRLGYAAGQIFVTHNDSGKTVINYSELLGNSTAVAISMAYYPDNRDASDAVSKLGFQLGVDMASNILKEFWPNKGSKIAPKKSSAPLQTPQQ
jgi:hypothetical protein